MAMLAVTFLVSAVTLGTGRTYMMQGAVHLVLFAAFLFLAFVPGVRSCSAWPCLLGPAKLRRAGPC
jgi:hypothetical protein